MPAPLAERIYLPDLDRLGRVLAELLCSCQPMADGKARDDAQTDDDEPPGD